MRRRALVLAVAVAVAACADGGDDAADREPRPERPSTTATPEAPTPTTSTTLGVRLDPGTTPTAACPDVAPMATPDPRRPRYRLDMALDLAAGVVTGDVAVRFRPDRDTDRLVFRLWPNGPALAAAGTRLEAGPVTLDGGEPVPGEQPDPTTLVVPLGRTLAAGTSIEASMPWRLTLPGAVEDRISRSGDAVRLGSFFPLLPWEPGVGWALAPPTTVLGESASSPVADFDWSLAVPEGLSVLGSGEPEGSGWWKAVAMRDLGISVGRFAVAEGTAAARAPVRVVVGVHEGLGQDPAAYRDRVVDALEDLSARFGGYPWPSFSLALTPDFPGGIEYPGHVMQGPGTIGRTTPHEIGHQWFYALVGNDQGRDPVLDEALATWAEIRADGGTDLLGTDVPADAEGRAGEPMTYWETHQASYYRGVYVQGAQALAALGDPDLVDCALRRYAAARAFAIARPADLIGALAATFPDAAVTLGRFGVVAAPR